MSHGDLRQLLLKEKPTDAALSIIELLFFSYQRKHFKIYSTQSAEFSKVLSHSDAEDVIPPSSPYKGTAEGGSAAKKHT